MYKIVSGCFIFLFISTLFITSVAAEKEEVTCDQLILKRCEDCHYKSRICQQIGQKSKGDWKRTVKNMVSYGAKLNKDEQTRLQLCLSSPSEEIKTLCK